MNHPLPHPPCTPCTPCTPPAADPAFLREVLAGLAQPRKSLPCAWLYDHAGSALFEQITRLPEYYPTRTETLILQQCAGEIGALAGPGACVVELGSGSSTKTPLLLQALQAPSAYVPVDISAQFLRESAAALQARFPGLPVHPLVADFRHLGVLPVPPGARRLLFFPGSTLGNLAPEEAIALLHRLARLAGRGGLLVLGADATQDPALLLPAYDDAQGVTAAFNLNLLRRINRELGADFDLAAFRHEARFDARERRIEMHLVSRREQQVQVAGVGFRFAQGESIHTENAYKYGPQRLQQMAAGAGWQQRQHWTDAQARFSIHVFEHEG